MYRVPDHIRSTCNKDGGTVLDLNSGSLHRLNFTASFVFECLANGKSQSQIVEELSRQFIVPRDAIHKDVDDFISSLEKRQILIRDF
jgi:hypothetical protein